MYGLKVYYDYSNTYYASVKVKIYFIILYMYSIGFRCTVSVQDNNIIYFKFSTRIIRIAIIILYFKAPCNNIALLLSRTGRLVQCYITTLFYR